MPNWATAYDFEKLTVSSTAQVLSASKYLVSGERKATQAIITVEDDAIRFRMDGTAPTAAIGHKLAVGSSVTLDGYDNIKNFKAIRVTNDATIHVSYLR